MYKKGEGVDKNYNKASELFKQFYKTHLLCNSSFLHKSLLDYFVVRDIYDDVNETDETQQVFLKVDDTLNKLKLLGEQSVIQFLAERVQEEPTFRNQLHEFINHSKTDESFQNVAANAITVLVKAGVQFNGADLNRIRVPGADLSYGIFDHAQFQGADLSKVNLQGAWIREVDFNHANMTGIEFGENPFIILENLNTNTHGADHDGISCYFSQDGQLLAGAIRDTIILYNAETFEEIWKSCGELDKYARVNDLSWKPSVSISQNGSLIAMGRWNNTISLWINKNERPLTFNFIGHTDKIYCVSISSNDEFIASGSRDCTVCLWSIREKRLLHIFKEHKDDVNSVSFSPNSKFIVSGSVDNMVYLWSVNKKKLVHAFEGHRSGVKSVSFSPDGEFIVSGSKDGIGCLWSVNEEKLLHTLQVSTDEVSSILFSPNGEYIISGSWDRTISLWSVKEKKLVHKFYGHTDRVTSVSSNSEFIASGSFDGQIRLWSIKDNEKFTHSLGRALINDDSISPSEDWIVDCFDLLRGSHVSDWSASSPDGKFIAKAKEQYIHLYSRENDLICTLEAEEQPDWKFNCISISPDSEFIAAGPWIENGLWGNYYDIKLFSVTDRELIHTFRGHQWQINCVSFSPDGELLASGSWDNTMRLWSLKEKKLLATFDHSSFGHERSCIECISFSPDSKFVITGGWNYTVALWSIENIERPQEIFDEHKNIIYDVKFSPDGKLIASASRDSTVRIWSALSGNKSLAIIRGFMGNVSHLAWNATPEGLFLHTISNEIIGNEDKFYRYWKIEQDGRKLRVKLQWAPYQSALTASDAHIQNINGLSPMNEKLLIQLGAKRKP
ncbi:WD40-repeat-containing domain protein [Glomus cerebriforme]|uniref:WD40-repeat-containing domain protein n=1 Tax=Glomus cerebriforme TaxID=658196 RepID=A0A397T9Z5_9GLOM|nr:WD40-repeat-containing domain protein [Glomus cerebriforme]